MGTKKYTKTAWVNGSAPAVSATNLLNIENGIEGANGIDVLKNNIGSFNTACGDYSLYSNTTGNQNSAFGYYSLYSNIGARFNTAIGVESLRYNTASEYNTAVGYQALYNNAGTGAQGNNTAIGYTAGSDITTGYHNFAGGVSSLGDLNTGFYNVAIGSYSLLLTTASTSSVAIGYESLRAQSTGYLNTAIGYDALTALTTFYNCTGLGANTAVTGNNQVQLGDAATTTYAYGAVQNRSDQRDKTDIKDTEIGLEFIKQLRPVDYRWNYREDYKEIVTVENEDGTREKQTIIHENDGSKKRTRFHHGLIAQEVKQVADTLGVDFGGYQDHKIAGGEDVLSIGYTELIAPMIKAIQQLNAKIELLESKLGGV